MMRTEKYRCGAWYVCTLLMRFRIRIPARRPPAMRCYAFTQ